MKYYKKNGSLYTSSAPITDENFVEITKDEYELMLSKIKIEYISPDMDDDFIIESDAVTEQYY